MCRCTCGEDISKCEDIVVTQSHASKVPISSNYLNKHYFPTWVLLLLHSKDLKIRILGQRDSSAGKALDTNLMIWVPSLRHTPLCCPLTMCTLWHEHACARAHTHTHTPHTHGSTRMHTHTPKQNVKKKNWTQILTKICIVLSNLQKVS